MNYKLYVIKCKDTDNDDLEYELGTLEQAQETVDMLKESSLVNKDTIKLYGYKKGEIKLVINI